MSRGDEEVWQTNFEAAKARAAAEHKMLLVEFSGSDWCPWCKKMQADVFEHESFKNEARKNFVLVNLDFPNEKQLPGEIRRQNKELKKQYKVDVFPTLMVMDPRGQVIAQSGYRAGGPHEFMKDMTGFVTTHDEIVAMKRKLHHVDGLDRAKLLDEHRNGLRRARRLNDDTANYNAEIITLDPDSKPSLKLKYTFRALMAEANSLSNDKKFAAARATYEKAAELPGLKGKRKQQAWFAEAECCASAQEFRRAVALLNKARDAAPDGPKVADIDAALKRATQLSETQQAVDHLALEAESAHGLRRAKALDRLIDAKIALGELLPEERHPQEIEQWSNEIIRLDSDNKAGLKTKYLFRELLINAFTNLKAGDREKARADIEEARVFQDLSDEQKAERFTRSGGEIAKTLVYRLLGTAAANYERDRQA